MHAYNCICANVPAQIACTTALNEGINAPLYMNRDYIERRNYLKKIRIIRLRINCST